MAHYTHGWQYRYQGIISAFLQRIEEDHWDIEHYSAGFKISEVHTLWSNYFGSELPFLGGVVWHKLRITYKKWRTKVDDITYLIPSTFVIVPKTFCYHHVPWGQTMTVYHQTQGVVSLQTTVSWVLTLAIYILLHVTTGTRLARAVLLRVNTEDRCGLFCLYRNEIAYATSDHMVYIRKFSTVGSEMTLINTLQGHFGEVVSVCWNPVKNVWVTGSDDGTIRVWVRSFCQLCLWLCRVLISGFAIISVIALFITHELSTLEFWGCATFVQYTLMKSQNHISYFLLTMLYLFRNLILCC